MKRIKILFFLVAIVIFSLSIGNKVKASSLIKNEDSPSALGKTINCVTAKSYGNVSTGYVLDRDYYDGLGYDVNDYDTKTECRYYTETSRENVKYNFNAEYSMESKRLVTQLINGQMKVL